MGHSPDKKNLGIEVDGKMDMNQQCALTAQKPNLDLGCIQRSMASREREVMLPLCSALVRAHLEYCIQTGSPQYRRDVNLLEHIQRRATEMECLPCGDRLRKLRLFSMGKSPGRPVRATFQYLNGCLL